MVELRIELQTPIGVFLKRSRQIEEDAFSLIVHLLEMRLVDASGRRILPQLGVVDTPPDGAESNLLLLFKERILRVLDLALIPDSFTELFLEVTLDAVVQDVQGFVFEFRSLG